MPEEKELVQHAREHVEAMRSFFTHLFTYIVVNLGLFLINYFTRGDTGTWWFYWPLLGWGIGVASHAFSVFGAYGLFGREWEEKQVKRYLEREARKREKDGGTGV